MTFRRSLYFAGVIAYSRQRLLEQKSNTPNSSGHWYTCFSRSPSSVNMNWKAFFTPQISENHYFTLAEVYGYDVLGTSYTGNILCAPSSGERDFVCEGMVSSVRNKMKKEVDERNEAKDTDEDVEIFDENGEDVKYECDRVLQLLQQEFDRMDSAFHQMQSSAVVKHNCDLTGCLHLRQNKTCTKKNKALVYGQKNPKTMCMLVQRFTSNAGQLVVDPFMGSGEVCNIFAVASAL